jgi:hypothetical protein
MDLIPQADRDKRNEQNYRFWILDFGFWILDFGLHRRDDGDCIRAIAIIQHQIQSRITLKR